MYKILLIEDDESLRNQVTEILRGYEYDVFTVTDFRRVMERVAEVSPDLIVLDINLPYFDGNYYCRTIRKKYQMPIIVTSARGGDTDQILSMELGCDEYVVKPFSVKVLVSRISACLRRSYGEYQQKKELDCCGMKLLTDSMRLSFQGEILDLSKNEFRLMKLMMENPDKVLSREDLLLAIWDEKEFVDDNTLTVNITRIKTKLSSLSLKKVIQTKRGSGYLFCTEELKATD